MKEKIIILIIIAAFLLSGSYYETVENFKTYIDWKGDTL